MENNNKKGNNKDKKPYSLKEQINGSPEKKTETNNLSNSILSIKESNTLIGEELSQNKEKLLELKNEYIEITDYIDNFESKIYSYIDSYEKLSDDAKDYINRIKPEIKDDKYLTWFNNNSKEIITSIKCDKFNKTMEPDGLSA